MKPKVIETANNPAISLRDSLKRFVSSLVLNNGLEAIDSIHIRTGYSK